MRLSDHPLWHLLLARLRHFFREPETIFWSFGFPTLLSIALGIAFRAEPPAPSTVAVAAGPAAAQTVAALAREPGLAVRMLPPEFAAAELRSGRAALLVLPRSGSGDRPDVELRRDPTRPDSRQAELLAAAALQAAAGRHDPLAIGVQDETTPGGRYLDFLVPGLLGMNLMGGGLWGIGWNIVEARNRRLLKRFLATPMRRRDYLLAHILARLAFVPLEVGVLLGSAALFFDLHVLGSIFDLLVVAVAGVLAFAGLGTLIASRVRTMEGCSGLINLASLPMMVFSGVFFSSERFPDAVQPIIRALPLTALTDGMRAVVNEGRTLLDLGPQLGVLAVWGLVCYLLALRLFRWT